MHSDLWLTRIVWRTSVSTVHIQSFCQERAVPEHNCSLGWGSPWLSLLTLSWVSVWLTSPTGRLSSMLAERLLMVIRAFPTLAGVRWMGKSQTPGFSVFRHEVQGFLRHKHFSGCCMPLVDFWSTEWWYLSIFLASWLYIGERICPIPHRAIAKSPTMPWVLTLPVN